MCSSLWEKPRTSKSLSLACLLPLLGFPRPAAQGRGCRGCQNLLRLCQVPALSLCRAQKTSFGAAADTTGARSRESPARHRRWLHYGVHSKFQQCQCSRGRKARSRSSTPPLLMDSRRSTRASCCPLRRWAPESSMLTIKTILWLPGLWLPWVCLPCPQWARLWCPADDSAGWPVLHWEDHLHTISPGEGLSWDKVQFNCTLWSSSRSRCIHCTRST